ncbi:MAG: hypothetical protein ACJ8F1_04800 [Polyangia bacterium]
MKRGVAGACLALSLVGGCGSGLGDVFVTPTKTVTQNSFTQVYTTVLHPSCSNDYCHYNGVSVRYSALDMSSQVYAYWSLVDQPCAGPSCSAMGTRVVPGDPDRSILYLKVADTMAPCGARMPANQTILLTKGTSEFSGVALPDDQQQLIHDWIAAGAPNN